MSRGLLSWAVCVAMLASWAGASDSLASGTISVSAKGRYIYVYGRVGLKIQKRGSDAAYRANQRRIKREKELVQHLSKAVTTALLRARFRLVAAQKGFEHYRRNHQNNGTFWPAHELDDASKLAAKNKRGRMYLVIRREGKRVVVALRRLPSSRRLTVLKNKVLDVLQNEPLALQIKRAKDLDGVAELLYERVKAGKSIARFLRGLKRKRIRAIWGQILHRALRRKDETLVRALIKKKKADVNAINRERYHDRPLHIAAEKGQLALCKLLVAKGATVDAKNEFDRTPLFSAIRAGHQKVVAFLLKKGADPHYMSQKYWSPLHAAAGRGDTEIVKLLLAKKANPLAKKKGDRTPLDVAKKPAIRALLKKAAQ
jgi:hypothetical protein